MYCRNCGQEIHDEAAFCPYCGVVVDQGKLQPKQKSNTLALVGFILSFFVAIAGLICSIIGYKNLEECGGNGRGFAIAGIVISIVSMVISFIYAIVACSMMIALL